MIALPWSISTVDNLDIERARQILDEDHYNLKMVRSAFSNIWRFADSRRTPKGRFFVLSGLLEWGKPRLGNPLPVL
jgi:ATP-dependent Lon protease